MKVVRYYVKNRGERARCWAYLKCNFFERRAILKKMKARQIGVVETDPKNHPSAASSRYDFIVSTLYRQPNHSKA